MPAYHSAFPKDCASVCGLAMLPLKTKARGPAVTLDAAGAGAEEDPVDEALRLFRANVLFRNFEVQGAPDRTLIYLTLLIHQVRRPKFRRPRAAARRHARCRVGGGTPLVLAGAFYRGLWLAQRASFFQPRARPAARPLRVRAVHQEGGKVRQPW